MENQILITLKNNKLFNNIPFDQLDFSKITGNFLSVHEGEILFREKAKSNLLYLIVSGEINILTKQLNSKALSQIFVDNDFFGCEEFLANIPRKSTAVALRDSYLIALTKEEVDLLIEQNYDILNNIYASIPDSEDERNSIPTPDEEIQPNINEDIINTFQTETIPQEEKTPSFESKIADDSINTSDSQEEQMQSDFTFEEKNEVENTFLSENAILTEEPKSDENILQSPINVEPEKTSEDNFSSSSYESSEFDLNERFGKKNFFNDEFQNMTRLENISEEPSNENKPEEDFKDFYKEDFSFYESEEKSQEINKKEEEEISVQKNEIEGKNFSIEEEHFPTLEHLIKINEAAGLVNTNIKIDDILKNIVTVACDLTNADRGTLYFLDKEKNELWSKIAMGSEFREIKLKIGDGIAGWVAKTGEILNLENVREDTRFNPSFDKMSGYETKNMICYPIKNQNGDIVGVLQLLNSKKGKFSKIDEEFLKALSIHIALAFRNANMIENLLSNERISSLGKMANFLIQDIKKPILVSKRYAEHLKTKELSEDVIKIVDMILEQLNHIADLIQSTLSYSEGQIILRSIVKNINGVLDDFIARIDGYVKSRNCKISKKFDATVNVKIAEKQFYQAFEHIIKNACDAMPDGGEILIETKKSGNNILISISDSGLGIPESLHQKIFEPFMSLGKREATGLGLSITKKIIEEHGGSISVKSQMGEGATFTISFPIIYTY